MTASADRSYICPIVVGRAGQLQAIERAIQQASQGEPVALLLAGEAGIGKSRLTLEAAIRAAAHGFLLLKGECFEGGHSVPYSAILELLRAHLYGRAAEQIASDFGTETREIIKLLPELASSVPGEVTPSPSLDAEQEKRRLFHALLRALYRLAAQQPLLVIIEDLHWSDETTLEFLQFMCRYPQGKSLSPRALVLMTYRSDEVQPALAHFLAQMDRTRSAVEVRLERLTSAETDVMMRAILDLRSPARRDFLDTLHNVTGGNPFYIEEVLKASSTTHDREAPEAEAAGGYQPEIDQVPRTVQDALGQRVARLSGEARRLLDVAAVAGMRLDIDLLRAVTHRDDDAMLTQLKEFHAGGRHPAPESRP